MKIKIQIKSIFGEILFEYEKENNTIKKTTQEAVRTGADLRGADLRGAYLTGAYLTGADLTGAYLTGADLRGAYLRGAYLTGAYLRGADLRGAYLTGADLRGADLRKIKHLFQIIPEEGAFIAWKKGENKNLIKLEIPKDAKRHNHLAGRKCRAEFVKVLDIRNSKGYKVKECHNGTHPLGKVLYRIGEITRADNYDPNPLIECSGGIHFFLTKQEAKDW